MLGKTMRQPVSARYWQTVRGAIAFLSKKPDALSPRFESLIQSGKNLPISELQSILQNDELGGWSLDSATIVHLWNFLLIERPRFMVECGCGVSTIVFAKFLSLLPKSEGSRRLISIEQNASWLNHSADRLKSLGLERFVRLMHVPVSKEGGYEFPCKVKIRAELDGNCVDWILIDGPFGPAGCRQGTLPFLWQLARPGARWCLDDAFRDGELSFLRLWSDSPNWSVQGIWPVGKGLATGHVLNSTRSVH
jgi:hypothetical protein